MVRHCFPIALILSSLLVACAPSPNASQGVLNNNLQANSASTPDARFYDTALNAYRWAQFDARSWDFAARLAKVEGTMVDEQGRSFEWKFYFTAPGKQKALLVTSRREKREVNNIYFGMIFDSSWRIDSDKALTLAKEHGLKRFPVWSMEIRDIGRDWEISSSEGRFRVDLSSGQVSKQ